MEFRLPECVNFGITENAPEPKLTYDEALAKVTDSERAFLEGGDIADIYRGLDDVWEWLMWQMYRLNLSAADLRKFKTLLRAITQLNKEYENPEIPLSV